MRKYLRIYRPKTKEVVALVEWNDKKARVVWDASDFVRASLEGIIQHGIDVYIPQQGMTTKEWYYLSIKAKVEDELFLENLGRYLELSFDFAVDDVVKDAAQIPKGPYCYSIVSTENKMVQGVSVPVTNTVVCPFYTHRKQMDDDLNEEIIVSFCELVQDTDSVLLSNQCKICGINVDEWEDESL